ncbi:MAG: rhomboid family intramembrane serine protease [Lachnospiraceae bacterium]|nr:rhomboid family intramembrane serine protease [Lachnospiraceae bacterium]
MNLLDKLERRFGRFAIVGLMRYVVLIRLIGAAVGIIAPGVYEAFLCLDASAILHGQVWRLLTFVLYPELGSSAQLMNGGLLLNAFFLAIELWLYYWMGSTLERVWGSFRFNLFYFSGLILNIIAMFCLSLSVNQAAFLGLDCLDRSLFLGFAVVFPEAEVLLMFLIPVKVKWLGYVYGIYLTYQVFSYATVAPVRSVAIVVSMANFIIFYVLYRRNQRGGGMRQRRKKRELYRQIHVQQSGTRHRCAICNRTEEDDENLEFRYCSKCAGNREYCQDHLFTHEHVKF